MCSLLYSGDDKMNQKSVMRRLRAEQSHAFFQPSFVDDTVQAETGVATASEASRSDQAPLSMVRMRMLMSTTRDPAAKELAREVYRLQSLIRRMALFVSTVQDRNAVEVLDITSRTLLTGLDQALQHEPAVTEGRAWARSSTPSSAAPDADAPRLHQGQPIDPPVSRQISRAPTASAHASRERLFTWKLVPEPGRPDPAWRISRYRGVVLARAPDALEARRLAAGKFRITRSIEEQAMPSPWERRSLVRCERVEERTYDHVEAASVVYP
jgi:hypothetical protein